MRKLMLSLLLMMAAMGAKAQFEKGTTYVAASTTSLGLSYSSSEKLNFGLDFTGGYFVQSAWMLYGKLGYDHTRYTDHFQMGVGGRYYFTQNGIYMGIGLQYEHATKSVNNLQLCPEVGYAFFVNRFITIEPAVYYHMSLNDFSDGSKVGLKLGLGFYSDKKHPIRLCRNTCIGLPAPVSFTFGMAGLYRGITRTDKLPRLFSFLLPNDSFFLFSVK